MTMLGRYRIDARIGEGAMAEVFRAYDTGIDRVVAIKALKAEYRSNPELSRRFVREATAAGTLSHAHIATIHDVGEADGTAYIAMELVSGQPLDEMIQTQGRMAYERVLALGHPDGRCARLCPCAWHRPSRCEAFQHSHLGRRTDGQAARFRRCPDRRGGPCDRRSADVAHPDRPDDRDAALHEPGAGARPRRGPSLRSLLARRRVLRDADRQARLLGYDARHDDAPDRPGGARADQPARAPIAPRACASSSRSCSPRSPKSASSTASSSPSRCVANGSPRGTKNARAVAG